MIVVNMLFLLILLVYITRSSSKVYESWQSRGYSTFIIYKVQWKNLRAFLRLLDTITGYLLFLVLFIYLFVFYSFLVLINFYLTILNEKFL